MTQPSLSACTPNHVANGWSLSQLSPRRQLAPSVVLYNATSASRCPAQSPLTPTAAVLAATVGAGVLAGADTGVAVGGRAGAGVLVGAGVGTGVAIGAAVGTGVAVGAGTRVLAGCVVAPTATVVAGTAGSLPPLQATTMSTTARQVTPPKRWMRCIITSIKSQSPCSFRALQLTVGTIEL